MKGVLKVSFRLVQAVVGLLCFNLYADDASNKPPSSAQRFEQGDLDKKIENKISKARKVQPQASDSHRVSH